MPSGIVLYVGVGLTKAPPEFKAFAAEFRRRLKYYYEVLDFVGLEGGTAVDVWNHDIGCVKKSTHMIAVVDDPSIGLGIEIREAIQCKNKPILCLCRQGNQVTRMIIGAAELELLTLEYYSDANDAILRTLSFVKRHPTRTQDALAAE